MKLDMDIIRDILIEVEETTPREEIDHFQLEGYDPEVTDYHVKKLKEAGFLRADFVFGAPPRAIVLELTYEGHQFLDSIRSNNVWQRLKKKAATEGGSIPFEVLKPLAIKYFKDAVGLPE